METKNMLRTCEGKQAFSKNKSIFATALVLKKTPALIISYYRFHPVRAHLFLGYHLISGTKVFTGPLALIRSCFVPLFARQNGPKEALRNM